MAMSYRPDKDALDTKFIKDLNSVLSKGGSNKKVVEAKIYCHGHSGANLSHNCELSITFQWPMKKGGSSYNLWKSTYDLIKSTEK